MIPTEVDTISENDLRKLISDKAEEGPRLDFKRELPKRGDKEASRRFTADVCAMANTAGGDIVYGLDQDENGRAGVLVGQIVNPDDEVNRLTNLVADNIEPRLHGVRFKTVALSSGGIVVVARVPRSSSGIHRVRHNGHFLVRESCSNKELDVAGIVNRIADLLGREDRVRDFFARRYADILTGQYPFTLRAGPKLVVHLLPPRDLVVGEHVDVFQFGLNDVPYLFVPRAAIDYQPCADGRAFWVVSDAGAPASTMLMHSGAVEAIMHLDIGDVKNVDLTLVEESVTGFVHEARRIKRLAATLGTPFTVRISLLGAQHLPLATSTHGWGLPSRIKQLAPVLTLPDTLIGSDDRRVDVALHAALRRAWNAWGIPDSPNYRFDDDAQEWRRKTA